MSEFNFKSELSKIYREKKDKWRTWGESYVSTLVLFNRFIEELKKDIKKWIVEKEANEEVIDWRINKLAGNKLTGEKEK